MPKLDRSTTPGVLLTVFFAIVVMVAGVTAIALLLFPGSTDTYFSWTLRPTWAAAVIGGLYLASVFVFGWALRQPRADVRSLAVGVLGLAVPTLVFTIVHREVFDLSRWQAIGWWALFITAPVTVLFDLREGRPPAPAEAPPWQRWACGVACGGAAIAAIAMWVTGTTLTIRYLGCWASFAAVVTGHAAIAGRRTDTRVAALVVVAAAVGVGIGGLRAGFA
jgi:hypothetical protein